METSSSVRDRAINERLGIGHLLGWTAAVAISLALVQLVRRLRLPADDWYFGVTATPISFGEFVLAFIYGTGFALSIFAIRTGKIWGSPGKIIAIVLASACLIHWGLDIATAGLMAVRFNHPVEDASNFARGIPDERGYILGMWYQNVSIYLGYLFSVPIFAYVIYRTWHQRSLWTLAWLAMLVFAVASIGRLYFDWHLWLPVSLRKFYFAFSVLLPVLAVLLAFLNDLAFHRDRLDWWTTSTVIVFTLGLAAIATISVFQ